MIEMLICDLFVCKLRELRVLSENDEFVFREDVEVIEIIFCNIKVCLDDFIDGE